MEQTALKVLHVDDNPNVRSFVEPGLRAAGFDYVAAANGWEALEKLESEAPDVVVLDVILEDGEALGMTPTSSTIPLA